MKRIIFFTLILLSVVLFSCKKTNYIAALYIPTVGDTTATATLLDLQQGRVLYINNCGQCHNYRSPDDYTVSQWDNILPQMIINAQLNSVDASLVSKYAKRGK